MSGAPVCKLLLDKLIVGPVIETLGSISYSVVASNVNADTLPGTILSLINHKLQEQSGHLIQTYVPKFMMK